MNRTGNLAGHRVDIGQIGVAGLALRRAHGDEDDLRRLRGVAKVGGELNLATGTMPSEQLGEELLMNRHQALVEFVYLVFIVVDAQDPMADFSKACGRHQTNVSRSDYRDRNGFAHLVLWTPL